MTTDKQRIAEQTAKAYRIDGEQKYLRLPSGGEVSTEATDCEIQFWAELQRLRTAHSEQGWVSRLVNAAEKVQLSGEAARHDSCTDTKNCPFAEFREALVAYKAALPAPPVHQESAQQIEKGNK